jgi:adenylate cyclase
MMNRMADHPSESGAATESVPHVERRLAAILSADVKGYSRLMVRLTPARGEGPPGPSSAAMGSTLKRNDTLSVAVLPFANMSDDPDQAHFTDGIADDIITDLSKIGELTVIARSSTLAYKGTVLKIPDVGRELGVRYVLEGSVRKVAGQVRIAAQLIDVGTGHHLWAERYDRDLKDVFAIQDEISQKIAMAVKLNVIAKDEAPGLS